LHKIILKKLATSVLFVTKLYTLFRPFYAGIGTIFMLHRVVPVDQHARLAMNRGMEVSVPCLEQAIDYCIAKKYDIISLGELKTRLIEKKYNDNHCVCFTFDDGYRDVYTHVLPLFRQYALPFAAYIPTSFPDHTARMWWYALEDVICASTSLRFAWKQKTYTFSTASLVEKNSAFYAIRCLILAQTADEIPKLLDVLHTTCGMDTTRYQDYALTWDQIRELNNDPLVTIGAHSVHHDNLARVSDDDLTFELTESRRIIEQHTGKSVHHFCYPFGDAGSVAQRECARTEQCGYATAVTTRHAHIFPEHAAHLCALPRIELRDNVSLDVLMSGAISALQYNGKKIITI